MERPLRSSQNRESDFFYGYVMVTVVFIIMMSISFLWLMVAQGTWMLILFGMIFGMAYGALSPLMSPMVGELFGIGAHGTLLGFTFLGGEIGEAIGPVMAGGIFDVTGSYQWAFLLGAIFSLMGMTLSFLLKPSRLSISDKSERVIKKGKHEAT